MKLVANIKLLPTSEQHAALLATLELANAACNWLSKEAWRTQTFGQFALQKQTYRTCREQFKLSAQMVIRCLAKVADAYKLDHEKRRKFHKHAAQPYDDRIFRFKSDTLLSLWTTGGREAIAYTCGERQRALLKFRKGEVDLMYIRGVFYLAVVCDVEEPETMGITDVLGIDLGIVNLATDSQGYTYTGEAVEKQRQTFARRRQELQSLGTRSAKRALRRLSGKQQRFQADTNHCLSKVLVARAQRSGCAIALEDLSGIRNRVQARRAQRSRLHNWGFFQLRQRMAYKAKLSGVLVIYVDPRDTSRQCAQCGHIDKANRRTQAEFCCTACGHTDHADRNAARNIRHRALVNVPMVAQSSLAVANADVSQQQAASL